MCKPLPPCRTATALHHTEDVQPMASRKQSGSLSSAREPGFRNRRLPYLCLSAAAFALLLALVSYHNEDTAYLAGGWRDQHIYRNFIGYVGAATSRGLFLTFGFAAYLLPLFLCGTSFRRVSHPDRVRPLHWTYWVGAGFVPLGAAMLFGIWPGTFPALASHLNLGGTPGGVIGQRICAPDSGLLRVLLNPAGSAIFALLLIALGLAVFWLHDWHESFCLWMSRRAAARTAGARETEVRPPKPTKEEKDAERRRAEEKSKRAARKLRGAEPPATPALPTMDAVEPPPAGPAPPEPGAAPPEAEAPIPKPAQPNRLPRARKAARAKSQTGFRLPALDLLNSRNARLGPVDAEEVHRKKEILQATLDSFSIDAKVGQATSGPRVTLFEVVPAPGVQVERISRISKNIAMELQATSLRMLTPIPGRKSVGIEVPNVDAQTVTLYNLLSSDEWRKTKVHLPVVLGRNIKGEVSLLDLAKAPHLLIAGATGSGKSVCINVLITSLLMRFTPEELRLILVDPKVVEFSGYNSLPHLVTPVVTDVKKVPLALRWVIREMENRYQLLAAAGVRNLDSFNKRKKPAGPQLDHEGKELPERLPYIVVVIDELADIMMTAKGDVENSLARIAQLSRATGIHTVIATQRPSVNVITGLIKANYPTRIAFQVTSQVDSRTILDCKGAEMLLGRGDMLFRPPGASKLERIQGALVEDEEIEAIVNSLAEQAEPEFEPDIFKTADAGESAGMAAGVDGEASEADEELIQQAIEVIRRDRRATTSHIQRRLRIGYNRAALVIETLEQRGIVGPQVGTMPREILIDTSEATDDTPDEEPQEPEESEDTI